MSKQNPMIRVCRAVEMNPTEEARAAAVEARTQMEADPQFRHVWSHPAIGGTSNHCGVWLKDGRDIKGLVTAIDILGNVTVVLEDGGTRQYLDGEVC